MINHHRVTTKKREKNYVIKLLSRFNNQNPSSSQPNSPIPSSTHGCNPPVADATQSTPPVAADAIASTPSLHVGSNASTPPNITPSPYTNFGGTHSTFAANNVEDEVLSTGDRPLIQPIGGG